jgi:S-disulfanyl-L-cysteine oxidoreductase SoxD
VASAGLVLGLWVATAHVAGGQAPSSLERGVYSIAQAARGKAHYEAFCASCHLGDLSGTLAADTGAPPLRGAPFVASMAKTGVASFFDHVKATMPADDPGTLKDVEYLEILAYLFEVNGFPSGPADLPLADLPRLRVPAPPR